MAELEQELRSLSAELAFPTAPDLVPSVRARLAAEPARRPLLRRPLVAVLAALAVAVAVALAVPPARTAIFEFLRIQGATIERVDTPPRTTTVDLGLASPLTLAKARDALAFEPLVPNFPELGRPDALYVNQDAFGGQIVFLYGSEDAPRLLVSEFRGDTNPDFIAKEAGPSTSIEAVMVGHGDPGFWVSGEPHALLYRGPDGELDFDSVRLSGDALLWQHGRLTLRIEGEITKERALELAATLE
jgi:hypothetical protein